jgi:hypothetical protein
MINIAETLIIIMTIIICTAFIIMYMRSQKEQEISGNPMLLNINYKQKIEFSDHDSDSGGSGGADTCTTTCDSLDPVSDPRYNMQQIIKQSILLEEHLTNKNKRCRDCITKHFLHIIGLSEEAQMLATNKISNYPLINESVVLYNELFKIWITNKKLNGKDEEYILYCTNKLRDHRKQLIVLYFFNEKYKITEKEHNDNHDEHHDSDSGNAGITGPVYKRY